MSAKPRIILALLGHDRFDPRCHQSFQIPGPYGGYFNTLEKTRFLPHPNSSNASLSNPARMYVLKTRVMAYRIQRAWAKYKQKKAAVGIIKAYWLEQYYQAGGGFTQSILQGRVESAWVNTSLNVS